MVGSYNMYGRDEQRKGQVPVLWAPSHEGVLGEWRFNSRILDLGISIKF